MVGFQGFPMPPAGQYTVDPVHSFVFFSVQHLVVGRVRGRFTSFAGTLMVADEPGDWDLSVTVETASVDTQNGRRDEDLRSARFLNTEAFPQMTYRGRGLAVEPGGHWTMFGELTVRGVSREVPLTGRFMGLVPNRSGGSRAAFDATARMKRRDFELTAELEEESGGLVVGHDVTIEISAELVQRP